MASKRIEQPPNYLFEAYRAADLKRIGWSYQRSLRSPVISTALRASARALQKRMSLKGDQNATLSCDFN